MFTFQPSRGGSPALRSLTALHPDTLSGRVVNVGVVMVTVTVVMVMIYVVVVRVFMVVVRVVMVVVVIRVVSMTIMMVVFMVNMVGVMGTLVDRFTRGIIWKQMQIAKFLYQGKNISYLFRRIIESSVGSWMQNYYLSGLGG